MDSAPAWEFDDRPRHAHLAWARDGAHLFASPEWGALISTLGASPVYAWNKSSKFGVCIGVFRRLGHRVALLGLPVVGSHLDTVPAATMQRWAREICSTLGLSILRVSRTSDQLDPMATSVRPELWIGSLQVWDVERRPRLRKDLAFSRRAAEILQVDESPIDGNVAYKLYSQTIASHQGVERYSARYFEALMGLAAEDHRVHVLSANNASGPCGFVVMVKNGDTGYYLHSAIEGAAKKLGVGDLLLARAIECARTAGCTRFDLMASPWDQPGLTRFKEKWADTRRLATTLDHAHGIAGRCVRWFEHMRRQDERLAAADWLP